MEIRPVPTHPDYLVGDDGSVWSRRKSKLNPTGELRPIKPQAHSAGYRCFTARIDGGKQVMLLVHVCVLEAFVGPCPDGMECRHFPDNDRANNRLANLSWGTPIENQDDKRQHGTMQIGESHHGAKMTEAIVIKARRMRRETGMSYQGIADALGFSETTVKDAVRGITWCHVPGIE